MNASGRMPTVALVGNPNTGKTTIFNGLTGLKQRTANYPGVTVEKKTGTCRFKSGDKAHILDLPGTYGLIPRSLDEEVVRDVLYGWRSDTPQPDFLLVILDANNLERNLYLALQVLETGVPQIWVLNMWDQAHEKGISIDTEAIRTEFGVRCVKTVGSKASSVRELKAVLEEELVSRRCALPPALHARMEPAVACEVLNLQPEVEKLSGWRGSPSLTQAETLRFISDARLRNMRPGAQNPDFERKVQQTRSCLEKCRVDWAAAEAESRYSYIDDLCRRVVAVDVHRQKTLSDRLDQVLTHPVWGLLVFFALMLVVFQSIFTWASYPMDLIQAGVAWVGEKAGGFLPPGELRSLVVDGVLPGVGNVVVFLPQIFLLFFFIALFEDFGYMARATFVLDRLMKKVGLNGKAFLPLLSSFACAIPGIMSTKTIEDRNDRLATILVAPLMSCSARLPVYALMIGAFIPSTPVFRFFDAKGLTLFSMYALSIFAGLGMAGLFRKTLLKGQKTPFLFEMPPYRIPNLKTVFMASWDNGVAFLSRAGSVIFMLSVVLWFLLSHPVDAGTKAHYASLRASAQSSAEKLAEIDRDESGEVLRESYAGRLGRAIEPAIRPLGFDWKIGIGLVGSFAAREVLVSTLAIVHNVGHDADEGSVDLVRALREDKASSGAPLYTPLTAITLMVFFVLACQCLSTVAIVRRETGGWKWPVFMILYMTALAWGGSFAVYQAGRLLGFAG